MKTVSIPSAIIEDPPHILLWEADEVVPALTIFIVLYMWDMILLAIVASLAFTKILSRHKSKSMRGNLFHIVWWGGVMPMNNKFPDGTNRKFFD